MTLKEKFFYWMSSSAFNYVLKQYPKIINGYHACGPGNTYEVLKKVIKDPERLEVVLSYNAWKNKLI
jgi:hydroxymethylbilane synthase